MPPNILINIFQKSSRDKFSESLVGDNKLLYWESGRKIRLTNLRRRLKQIRFSDEPSIHLCSALSAWQAAPVERNIWAVARREDYRLPDSCVVVGSPKWRRRV